MAVNGKASTTAMAAAHGCTGIISAASGGGKFWWRVLASARRWERRRVVIANGRSRSGPNVPSYRHPNTVYSSLLLLLLLWLFLLHHQIIFHNRHCASLDLAEFIGTIRILLCKEMRRTYIKDDSVTTHDALPLDSDTPTLPYCRSIAGKCTRRIPGRRGSMQVDATTAS